MTVDTDTMTTDVEYDDERTDISEMEAALAAEGYGMEDVTDISDPPDPPDGGNGGDTGGGGGGGDGDGGGGCFIGTAAFFR